MHVGHAYLCQGGRAATAGGCDPPVRRARHTALRAAFLRALAPRSRALRRIRSVAEPDHDRRQARHAADPGQWPPVGALIPPLATGAQHDLGPVALLRSVPGAIGGACRALPGARRAAGRDHRQSQARRAGAARQPRCVRSASVCDRRTYHDRRSLHACRRGDAAGRGASAAARLVPATLDDHRATPPGPRAWHSRDRACRRPQGEAALARRIARGRHRHLRRRHHGRARPDLSRRARRLRGRFAREPWRPEPDRGDQARRRHPAWPACVELRGNLCGARQGARRRAGDRRGQARGPHRSLAQKRGRARHGGGGGARGD